MLIANGEVHRYIANPDIHRSPHLYQSPFGDWATAAVGPKHSASKDRLVHWTSAITMHCLVHLAEADAGGPVSVFGLMTQQPAE